MSLHSSENYPLDRFGRFPGAHIHPRRSSGKIFAGLAIILLTIVLFSPANVAMDIQLDASNYGSYSYFTARHFQYGSEVIPMAGPYGFVPYGFTYAGTLFWERLILELVTKLALSSLVLWFYQRALGHTLLRMLWLAAVALLTPVITDLPYILAILLSGLFLIEQYGRSNRWNRWACAGVAAYLALLTLFKGTQTLLALGTLGLLTGQALLARRFLPLAYILAAYCAALIGLCLAAGQNPLHLPGYVHGILELSSGYNAAMALDEATSAFASGLAATIALITLVVVTLWPQRRNVAALSGGLLLAGTIFVLWKHGFVRADGHMLIYFQFVPILGLTISFFLSSRIAPQHHPQPALALLAFILLLSLWADGKNIMERFRWNFTSLPVRLTQTTLQLLAPVQAKANLDSALASQRRDWQLPRYKHLIGRASVDFFGNELGYLLLNRFNYRPRPMGGGTFNVFTPWLRQLNAAHVRDTRTRPEYFVANFQTIDERFAAQDDAGTLLALLQGYTPVEFSAGLVLFKAASTKSPPPSPEHIATQSFSWGESIAVPAVRDDEILLMSFEAPPNAIGRLRQALYKAPLVFMDLAGSSIGLPANRRVIPLMFNEPVPLNPVLETNEDLLDLIAGQRGKTAHALVLKTRSPAYFDRAGLRIHFYRMARPPVTPHPPVTLSHTLVSSIDPHVVEAAATFLAREDGLVYQVLVPPGRLGYMLRGDETELRFTYGMTAPSYKLPTDGVNISVDLQRPGHPTQMLFQDHHTPRQRPELRGPQSVQLTLPPFPPGSMLNLRTGWGPDNDGAWDLVYLTKIDFSYGPYTSAQFPGFDILPESVEAGNCGRYTDGTRDIFLLNAPGSLTFALPDSARIFQLKVGLLSGAYTGSGQSDGIEITIALHSAQGSNDYIFRQRLDPRMSPSDRGDQTFDITLPAFASGTRLTLSLGPGPANDPSWDWSYIAGVSLR